MYGFCTFWGRHFKETLQDVGFSCRTFYHQDVCTISLSVMMTFPGHVIDCFPLLQTQLRKAANWNQKRQQLNLKPWSRGRSRSFFLHCYSEIMISMASKASQLSWKGGRDSGAVKSSCYKILYNECFRSLFRFTSGKKWKNFTHFPPFEPFWKALVETSHIRTKIDSREYIDSLRVKLIEFLALHNISVYIIQVLLDKDIFRVALKLWYCGMLNVATWCSTTHEWM